MAILDLEDPGGKEPEEQEQTEQQDEKSYRGTIYLLLLLPVIIFPFFTNRTELIIGVSFSLVMTILAIIMCWEFRRRVWFWIVVALVYALDVSLAVFAHWPKVRMTRLTLMPIALMYYCITVGVVRVMDRFVFKSKGPSRRDSAA
jgi:hypothetical protein